MFTPHHPTTAVQPPPARLLDRAPLARHVAALERGLTDAQRRVDALQRWLAS